MNVAILCDFDDTIAQGNMAHLILDRFGDGSWRELRRLYREGTIPPEDYFEHPFTAMSATRNEMKAYVRQNGHIDESFPALAHYCRRRNVQLAIVSLGLDFYVQALLEENQLDWIPVYAVQTRSTNQGIQFQFPYAHDQCERWGICKCSVVERYQKNGLHVIYIGDGSNDLCPARKANKVFAMERLLELCRQEKVPHIEFRDFTDVIAELERY